MDILRQIHQDTVQTHKTWCKHSKSRAHRKQLILIKSQFYFLQSKAQWLIMEAPFIRTKEFDEKYSLNRSDI